MMLNVINNIVTFFTTISGLWLYVMIFVLKTIEVSIAVVRMILINKGERLIASIISFFEVLLWIFLIGTVLIGFEDDPITIVIYAAGFAFGQYIGSLLENALAIGSVRVEAIIIRSDEVELTTYLREKSYAITTMKAQGMKLPRSVLIFYVPRKKVKALIKDIKVLQPNVVLTVDDVKPIYGGYNRLRSRRK